MFWNYYNEYDLDLKNIVRNNDYISLICNGIGNMFDIPDMSVADKFHLITELVYHGTVLVKKSDNGKFIIAGGHYVGVPKPDEIFPDDFIAVKNNFKFNGKPDYINETIAYLIPERQQLDVVFRHASQLSEIDTSLVNNVQFSRIAPIPVVSTDADKNAITEAIKGMIQGKLINTIKAKFVKINQNDELFPVINISNGEYAEKIQYLSMYHEQEISRICRLLGINFNFISKQSQITNDELNSGENFTRIYPYIMYQCLNESLNKIGIHVNFSDAYKWIIEKPVYDPDTNEPDEKTPAEPDDKKE